MDYNESKWYQLGVKNKTTTHYGNWEKKKHNYLTPEEFADLYRDALVKFITKRLDSKEKAHIEDISLENAAFAEAFLSVVEALYRLENR